MEQKLGNDVPMEYISHSLNIILWPDFHKSKYSGFLGYARVVGMLNFHDFIANFD